MPDVRLGRGVPVGSAGPDHLAAVPWLWHRLQRRSRHEGQPHWYLRGPEGYTDLTAAQFDTPVPYGEGQGKGFLTKLPSRRAQVVIDRVTS